MRNLYLLASCIRKAGCETAIEPPLQRLSGEQFTRPSTTTDDEARLDIKAAGFWGDGCEEAFFDVRVFNPFAASYRTLSVPALYRRHEREKRARYARYEERVREVERAAFTPLVFSVAGGASKLTTTFLKRLVSLLVSRSYHLTTFQPITDQLFGHVQPYNELVGPTGPNNPVSYARQVLVTRFSRAASGKLESTFSFSPATSGRAFKQQVKKNRANKCHRAYNVRSRNSSKINECTADLKQEVET